MSQFLSGLGSLGSSQVAAFNGITGGSGLGVFAAFGSGNPYPNDPDIRNAVETNPWPVPFDKLQNPNYLVQIDVTTQNGTKYKIYASLPDTWNMHINSAWAPIFANTDLVDLGGSALKSITGNPAWAALGLHAVKFSERSFGMTGQLPQLGQLAWSETMPLQFMLPLQFNATMSARQDVMLPMTQLLSLVAPSIDPTYGTLVPPGPTISQMYDTGQNNQYKVTLHLGPNIHLDNMIIADATVQVDSMTDSAGNFLSVQVDTTFTTPTVITTQLIAEIFGTGSITGTNQTNSSQNLGGS